MHPYRNLDAVDPLGAATPRPPHAARAAIMVRPHPGDPLNALRARRQDRRTLEERTRSAFALFIRTLLETEAEPAATLLQTPAQWWDVRALLDLREQPAEVADMNLELLELAATLGVVVQHPLHPMWMRVPAHVGHRP